MKYLICTISLLILVSCKDSKKQETITKTTIVEQPVEANKEQHDEVSSNVYDNAWTSEIKMNNDLKWKANAETNDGVKKMKSSIKMQTTSVLSDYHKLAEQLNSDKNYVIKKCTMKGASHDNLHVWLLPLTAKIEALLETKSVEDASKIKHSIEENINAYSDYFE